MMIAFVTPIIAVVVVLFIVIGALALLRWRSGDYALVITDLHMPGMDGESLGRLIRDDPELAETRCVMLTSGAMRGDAARMRQAGFEAYLTKPLKEEHIHRCLSALRGHPIKPEQPLITRHSLNEASKPLPARVLLVEDNLINQRLAVTLLERKGHQVRVTGNGEEALAAAPPGKSVYDLAGLRAAAGGSGYSGIAW